MKEVIAILRSNKWQATKKKLLDMDINSFTVKRVSGRGQQKGLQYLYFAGRGKSPVGMSFVAKRLVWFWLSEDQVEPVVTAIMEVNRTGEIGDGKIFVCPIEDAIRIRTGEAGLIAVS